ncbi:MAG: transposase [Candidatus Jettenia sp.]|nr:MAG: transposase [Candidatus Jettenia sp.]
MISPSEINYLLLANGKSLEPLSEQILRAGLPKSTYAHLDESGWKTQGVSKHLWTICTNTFSYFQIHPRRNFSVANELVSFNSLLRKNG